MQQCFVFCSIVRIGIHVLQYVLHDVASGGYEDYASPQSSRHLGSIEVHYPICVGRVISRELGFFPFGNEIGQHLGLYGPTWAIHDLEREELDGPLCDPANGVMVVDDIIQRDLQGNRD